MLRECRRRPGADAIQRSSLSIGGCEVPTTGRPTATAVGHRTPAMGAVPSQLARTEPPGVSENDADEPERSRPESPEVWHCWALGGAPNCSAFSSSAASPGMFGVRPCRLEYKNATRDHEARTDRRVAVASDQITRPNSEGAGGTRCAPPCPGSGPGNRSGIPADTRSPARPVRAVHRREPRRGREPPRS
jgi:hypothetical protein